MAKKAPLTPKQKIFCEEYIIDLNATQAAIRAGYSKKTANTDGPRLLVNARLQEYLQKLMSERSARTEIDADNVLRETAKLAFSNIKDYLTFGPGGVKLKESDELTDDQLACVSEVSETVTKDGGSKRFKLHDKTKNLELLFRHLGLFHDKLDLNHKFNLADFMRIASQDGDR